MTVQINVPPSIEEAIRSAGGNVDVTLREAAFVHLYRQGLISTGQLAEALDLARTEVDALLTRHGVTEDFMSIEEFRRNIDEHRRLAG